jgi:hypothetical protein
VLIDLDRTFAGQPRELDRVLARVDTGRGREQLFLDQVPEVLQRLSENARRHRSTYEARAKTLCSAQPDAERLTPPQREGLVIGLETLVEETARAAGGSS